jgi:hypothetical protein
VKVGVAPNPAEQNASRSAARTALAGRRDRPERPGRVN